MEEVVTKPAEPVERLNLVWRIVHIADVQEFPVVVCARDRVVNEAVHTFSALRSSMHLHLSAESHG